MIAYDDADLDAVSELVSIGVNRAAAALGEMAGREVSLSVPTLSIIDAVDLVSEMCTTTDSVCGIFKRILRPLDSYAVVILPLRKRDDLVRYLVPVGLDGEDAGATYDDAVTEIGNIMIGACLGAIADTLDIEIDLDQPVIHVEHPSEFFLTSVVVDDLCEYFLDIRIDMAVLDTPLRVTWEFLLPDAAFDVLRTQLRLMLGEG